MNSAGHNISNKKDMNIGGDLFKEKRLGRRSENGGRGGGQYRKEDDQNALYILCTYMKLSK